ncbi:prepilin peptidase [SAR86 cluster bacterium]|uniref:Prepilin peptidase n=1 Tax=SAR86 cluster bacterium TaxID=2030880 RepID=A0A9Q8TXS7_9GAMM|nr:prepilin peptidase [SAR86 cluster bacterium]
MGILVGAIMAFFDQLSVGLLISLLIFLIFLDERYKEIPITLNFLIIILVTISIPNISLNDYVAPLIVMAFLLLIYFGFLLIKKKEGMGLGDIILIFSISLFIGFPNILYLITIASSLLLLKIIFTQKYKEQHAFGSWLAGVFLTFILFQEFYVFEGSVTI